MINNRQAGRRRGRNNNNNNNNPRQNGGGGGGNRGNGDSGNRIDNRARGNAAQLLEKYRNLARDAQMMGDRVNAEYYLQFADHYFRVLADNRTRQEEQQQRFRRPDEGDQDSGGDYDGNDMNDAGGDDMDEFAPQQQVQPQQQEQRPRQERNRGGERTERSDRGARNDRGERNDRVPRSSDRNDRGERSDDGTDPEHDRGGQRFANDDSDGDMDIGLPGLPPSIARVEADEDERPQVSQDEPEVAPKPRRGRRPRQPEAAE